MRAAEKAAFARGVTAERLMDDAGAGIARAVTRFFPAPADCILFLRNGHKADAALDHVGRIETVSLRDLTMDGITPDATVASGASLHGVLPRRTFSAYKNQFGRVGIVAGSRGLTGAAVLCASGALRGGAGLV